tara:strand:- start:5504 stop:6139 length:636 start_codon:yes stop_codon:yes gene_type:complete
MQVIINLEHKIDVECLKHALELTEQYWRHPENSWLYGSGSDFNSIIIEDEVPTGYLHGINFMDWDDTEAIKENSAMSNPFTNGSSCSKHWDKVKHNFIPILYIPNVNTEHQIASIVYKNDEIEVVREQESEKYPYVYFIDVFKCDIRDNDEALYHSESFSEISHISDYLENNFDIPKSIINQLESSKTYQKFLQDHKERLDHITNNIKEDK